MIFMLTSDFSRFEQFKEEVVLWDELHTITGALKTHNDDENGVFLQGRIVIFIFN